MNHLFFVWFTLTLMFMQSHGTSDIPKHCNNGEICLTKTSNSKIQSEMLSLEAPSVKVSEKIYYPNSSGALNDDEVYLVKKLGQISGTFINKNSYAYKLQTESTESPIDTSSRSIFSSTANIDSSEETIKATTGTSEVTEISFGDLQNKSIINDHKSTTEMTVTKSSVPTTQSPHSMSHFIVKQNLKEGNICFCDLKVNECDINCCCDEDCTKSHLKVFTKCINDENIHDGRYCYKNHYIFANNTSHKIIQKRGGFFCIAKENVQVTLNYETKPALKTLDAFNKSLPVKSYVFSYKIDSHSDFNRNGYVTGLPVWMVQNDELRPFKIPHSTVGFLCNSGVNIRYLVDQVTTCFTQHSDNECEGKKIRDVLHELSSMKIISSPSFVNMTQKFNPSQTCAGNACIKITSFICQEFDDGSECLKVKENSTDFLNIGCWNALSNIEYQIWHNGSQGILKVGAQLWVRKLSRSSSKVLSPLITDVQFKWVGSSKKVLKRSGNPGYLTGRPVLAGRKIYLNETSKKKEAMEVSSDPNDWLNVLGSKKGLCLFKERIPVNFRENGQFMCSLQLTKDNFTKERCLELQNNIYKLLIGQDVINITKENYFNKFVATFGNSRVEETGDWVQVLIDLFSLSSSQTSFKSKHYHVMCKNIITDLYVDIVYSNVGSVLAPQAKILGVSFRFGKHKDWTYHCDSPGCENTSLVQYFKLSTSVNFIDVSKPAIDAFAEPLHLEAKLPHDFFYPFFSRGYRHQVLNKCICLVILSAFF